MSTWMNNLFNYARSLSECRHLFNHRTISEKTNSKQIKYREGNEKPLPSQPYYELSLRLEVGGRLHQPSGLFLFEFEIYKQTA